MSKLSAETVGVRYTGWAALHRDPLEDRVEYTLPRLRRARREGSAKGTGRVSFH